RRHRRLPDQRDLDGRAHLDRPGREPVRRRVPGREHRHDHHRILHGHVGERVRLAYRPSGIHPGTRDPAAEPGERLEPALLRHRVPHHDDHDVDDHHVDGRRPLHLDDFDLAADHHLHLDLETDDAQHVVVEHELEHVELEHVELHQLEHLVLHDLQHLHIHDAVDHHVD